MTEGLIGPVKTSSLLVSGPLLLVPFSAWFIGQVDGDQDRRKGESGSTLPHVATPKADTPKAATFKISPQVGPPEREDTLTAQELTDQFLVVRAQLDKPGENPVYELGEPVAIDLDIRNTSDHHYFNIPQLGFGRLPPGILAMGYVVEARRSGEPVPPTTLGRRSVELLKRNDPVIARYAFLPTDDIEAHPRASNRVRSGIPIRYRMMANVLCDMTDGGDYELVAKFNVGVLRPKDSERRFVNAIKVVQPTPPLRLKVAYRPYVGERPPAVVAPAP